MKKRESVLNPQLSVPKSLIMKNIAYTAHRTFCLKFKTVKPINPQNPNPLISNTIHIIESQRKAHRNCTVHSVQ